MSQVRFGSKLAHPETNQDESQSPRRIYSASSSPLTPIAVRSNNPTPGPHPLFVPTNVPLPVNDDIQEKCKTQKGFFDGDDGDDSTVKVEAGYRGRKRGNFKTSTTAALDGLGETTSGRSLFPTRVNEDEAKAFDDFHFNVTDHRTASQNLARGAIPLKKDASKNLTRYRDHQDIKPSSRGPRRNTGIIQKEASFFGKQDQIRPKRSAAKKLSSLNTREGNETQPMPLEQSGPPAQLSTKRRKKKEENVFIDLAQDDDEETGSNNVCSSSSSKIRTIEGMLLNSCLLVHGDNMWKQASLEISDKEFVILSKGKESPVDTCTDIAWNFVSDILVVDSVEQLFRVIRQEDSIDDQDVDVILKALEQCPCSKAHCGVGFATMPMADPHDDKVYVHACFPADDYEKLCEHLRSLTDIQDRIQFSRKEELDSSHIGGLAKGLPSMRTAIENYDEEESDWPIKKKDLFVETQSSNRRSGRPVRRCRKTATQSYDEAVENLQPPCLSETIQNTRVVRYPYPWGNSQEIVDFVGSFHDGQTQRQLDSAMASGLFTSVTKLGSIGVAFRDVIRLQDGEFLNDTLIDFWLKYRTVTLLNYEMWQRVHVFSSLFFKAITGSCQTGRNWDRAYEIHKRVERWTKNVDVFSKDILLIPVHRAMHWSLAVVIYPGEYAKMIHNRYVKISPKQGDRKKVDKSKRPCIALMDSIQTHKLADVKRYLRRWLLFEWLNRYPGLVDSKSAMVETAENVDKDADLPGTQVAVPRQYNSCDCGVFVLKYAEVILQLLRYQRLDHFVTEDMNEWSRVFGTHGENLFEFTAIKGLRQRMYDVLKKMHLDQTFHKVCSIPSVSELHIFKDKVEERKSIDGDCDELNVDATPRVPEEKEVEVEETIDLSSAE